MYNQNSLCKERKYEVLNSNNFTQIVTPTNTFNDEFEISVFTNDTSIKPGNYTIYLEVSLVDYKTVPRQTISVQVEIT